MMRWLRTIRSASSRPGLVSSGPLRGPRSMRPSASSRFIISLAVGGVTCSISATRAAGAGASFTTGPYSPTGNARK